MLSTTTLWVCIITYLIIVLGISSVVHYIQNKRTHGNLFSAKLPWPQAVMTYIASQMSTWLFFAGPGGYYRGGFVYFMAEMGWVPMFMLISHFVLNKVWALNRHRDYVTPSDFFADRFQSPALRAITGLVFLASSLPYVTSVLVAIAQGAQVATDGAADYTTVCIVIGVAMVIFTAIGGFKSVALTDTIQGVIFIIAIWVIALTCLGIGFNFSLPTALKSIYDNAGSEWFSMPGLYNWVPYGYRFGYPFSCMIGLSVMVPHVFVRACYASKDLDTQRKVNKLTPPVRLFTWFGCLIVGIVGIALLPGLEKSTTEMIIPFLVKDIVLEAYPALATVLMILFFVGATGVGISTADSYLLVAASIVSDDFIGKLFKVKLTQKKKENIGRLVILIIGLLSVFMAMNPPDLIYTLIMFACAIVMPLFPILVLAIYWKRATKAGAIAGALVGTVLVLLTYFVWHIGNTWYGAIGVLGSLITMVVVSLVTKDTTPEATANFYATLDKGLNEIYDVDPAAK